MDVSFLPLGDRWSCEWQHSRARENKHIGSWLSKECVVNRPHPHPPQLAKLYRHTGNMSCLCEYLCDSYSVVEAGGKLFCQPFKETGVLEGKKSCMKFCTTRGRKVSWKTPWTNIAFWQVNIPVCQNLSHRVCVLKAVSEWQHWEARLSWVQTSLEQYKEMAGKCNRAASASHSVVVLDRVRLLWLKSENLSLLVLNWN